MSSGAAGGSHRAPLFDLAVERATTYLSRARAGATHDRADLLRALEVWYLKTRFAARFPLEAIVDALAEHPAPGEPGWRWEGGPGGGWSQRGREADPR